MKTTILLAILLAFSSCQLNSKPDTDEIKDAIVYFKDQRTGLCFAAVNSVSANNLYGSSIACVPCSLCSN